MSHADSMHHVNPVTYTLFERTRQVMAYPAHRTSPSWQKKKIFENREAQVGRCDTNLIHFAPNVLAILLKKNKNLDRQSGRGVFCNDTSCFIHFFWVHESRYTAMASAYIAPAYRAVYFPI